MATDDESPAVSNTVETLKSRYYKYLDTLCQANAIDIGTLKGNAALEIRRLELFFGGLPVLVGLRYFPALKVLRLFGQEVISLRPLADLCGTLEELWLCEGPLKNISGIESCGKLRQLYLYDCQIEDASLLCRLYALETLWIMNNQICDFSFISALSSLKILYAGGTQFSSSAALSIEEWPSKLQHLDLFGNSLSSLKEIFLLARCTVMRVLNLTPKAPAIFPRHEGQLAWIAFHFCYLERFNGDIIADNFSETYTNCANKELMDQPHRWLNAERAFRVHSERIRRTSDRIDERLQALVAALCRALNTVSKREGRREIVSQTLRQAQNNLARLKYLKKNYIFMEYFAHLFANYYVPSWRMESARRAEFWPKELADVELRALEQHLLNRFSKKEELTLHARYALQLTDIGEEDYFVDASLLSARTRGDSSKRDSSRSATATSPYEQLVMIRFFENTLNCSIASKTTVFVRVDNEFYDNCCCMPKSSPPDNCNLRLALYFCDNCHRRGAPKRTTDDEAGTIALCTVTDLADILTAEDQKNCFIILLLFRNRAQFIRKTENSSKAKGLNLDKLKSSGVKNPDDKTVIHLRDLDVAVLCLLEINDAKCIQFEELNDVGAFEERIVRQIRKFRELGIEIRLGATAAGCGDVATAKLSAAAAEDAAQEAVAASSGLAELLSAGKDPIKKNKYRVADLDIGTQLGALRWRVDAPHNELVYRSFSLRNPLDLTLALYRAPVFKNKDLFQKTVTCLDLSELKLKRLNGIESLANLCFLKVARNWLVTLDALGALDSLTYLDASSNKIAKIVELPAGLVELNLARNALSCLLFCAPLTNMQKLNVNANRIKSLKGIESMKSLEILQCANNLFRDRNEIEILSHFTNLHIVDMSECPITEMESFRKRLHFHCPSLISINHEKVPNEEKNFIQRKSGKVLTLEYLERHFGGEFSAESSLMLNNRDFRMIALDHLAISKLQSITFLDLSSNFLEHVYEVVELVNLCHLNLANNVIVSLCASNQISTDTGVPVSQIAILPGLTHLNLSENKINNQTFTRLGISRLTCLEVLNLSGNELTKLDSSTFEANLALRELNVSRNDIRQLVKKKSLTSLKTLDLSDNKLKDIDGLCFSQIEKLNLANNKINNCAGLKPIGQLPEIRELICAGNAVMERRVYADFILEQSPKLQLLDGVSRSAIRAMPNASDRRQSFAAVLPGGGGAVSPEDVPPSTYFPDFVGMDTKVMAPDSIGKSAANENRSFSTHRLAANTTPAASFHTLAVPNSLAASRRSSSTCINTSSPKAPPHSYTNSVVRNRNSRIYYGDYSYFPMSMSTKSMPSLLAIGRNTNNEMMMMNTFPDSSHHVVETTQGRMEKRKSLYVSGWSATQKRVEPPFGIYTSSSGLDIAGIQLMKHTK